MRSINYYVYDVAVIMWRMQSLEQGQSWRTGKNAVCHTDTVSGGGCSCDSYARINRVVPCPGYKNKLIEIKEMGHDQWNKMDRDCKGECSVTGRDILIKCVLASD